MESEFTENNTALFTDKTMQTLFPGFDDVLAKGLTDFAALERDLRPLVYDLGSLKVPSPATGTRDITGSVTSEEVELQGAIGGELRDDIHHLSNRLDVQLSSAVADASRQYNADIGEARRRRRWRYFFAVAGAVLLVCAVYVFYMYVNRDVPQDMFNSIGWNLVADVIAACVGWGIAKLFDNFPKATQRILEDSRSILRGKIFQIVDDALKSHEFSSLGEAKLSRRLVECFFKIMNVDPDGWNTVAAERIDSLSRFHTEYTRLRNEYERTVENVFEQASSYFSDVKKNLDKLNEVAALVKREAIEPSFKLLAETRASLEDVKNHIKSVEFQV